MEQYSKYKLFRKYITSDGINYTPIADYQAYSLNKKNQCDCGYRTYENRFDGEYICGSAISDAYKPHSKYEIWHQHALCPDDPNIDEIVPGTIDYRKPVKSEECGYIIDYDAKYESNQDTTAFIINDIEYKIQDGMWIDNWYVKLDLADDFRIFQINKIKIGDYVELINKLPDTSKVTDMSDMFRGCRHLRIVDLSNFNTSKVTNMSSMFSGCEVLTSLNLNSFDTSKVTNMSSMFSVCKVLTSLNLNSFDTNKVTNMSGMFSVCESLTTLNLNSFDTSKVTNMSGMFKSCGALPSLDLSNFDTSKVTNMQLMFEGCDSLVSLDLSNFDTSKVTNMDKMFFHCHKLTNVNLSSFNTSNVTNMNEMFWADKELVSLDLSSFNVSKVTNMQWMFRECFKLKTINLSNWELNPSCNTYQMFDYDKALTSIIMDNCSCETIKRIQDRLVADRINGVTIYSNTGCEGTVPTPTNVNKI